MIAVVTVLVALPAGYLLRSRLAANVTFAIAYLWAFSFQNVYLTRMWVGGDEATFAKDPDTLPIEYGLVAAGIFAVGFGLVALGHRLGTRRRAPRRQFVLRAVGMRRPLTAVISSPPARRTSCASSPP